MADQSPATPIPANSTLATSTPANSTPEPPAEEAAAAAAEGTETQEAHVPVTPDIKSAFAAALERKKQAGQARSAHLDGHGGVGGATSSHKATRTFRRKSGSA